MLLDCAPMEGITTSSYRQLHHRYFPGVDRYYLPFFAPTQDHRLTERNLRGLSPERNRGITAIPQLLTKSSADFLWAAGELHAMGYGEVNLNAGCPSGTVTAKGKGSGLLRDPACLERFLDEIFADCPCAISVKTRLGMADPAEFEEILEIYNRYPIRELIIHPRVRQDLYRHAVRRDAFEKALQNSKNPVSYNGGLVTVADYEACAAAYPRVKAIMVGQAMTADPSFAMRVKTGQSADRKTLQAFYDELFEEYARLFGSRPNAVHRMKELWFYQIRLFRDSEDLGKKLRKSKTPEEYLQQVRQIFETLELLPDTTGGW